jgi:hypothetical protein
MPITLAGLDCIWREAVAVDADEIAAAAVASFTLC